MANHVIYDRIWESRKLAMCSLKAALAYPWIYLVADDWGRFEYLPKRIWGMVFGAREDVKLADVVAWLDEYERVGLLVRYDGNPPDSSSGTPIHLCAWVKFVGPPPAKRRPPTLPGPDGVVETEGFRVNSRFQKASNEEQARNRDGSQPASLKLEAQAGSRKQEAEATAQRVFAHWVSVMGKDPGATQFTDGRRRAVVARLNQGYPEADLLDAITGCRATPFNMGDNRDQKPWNDLTLICRNGENVERFRDVARKVAAQAPPAAPLLPYQLTPEARAAEKAAEAERMAFVERRKAERTGEPAPARRPA